MKPEHILDEQIARLLQKSGFKVSVEPTEDGEPCKSVKAFGPDGDVTYKKSRDSEDREGDVVALARPAKHNTRKAKAAITDHNGKLIRGYVVTGKTEAPALYDPKGKEKVKVTYELEHFPSGLQAGVTLTRNLKEDACLRFLKKRGCTNHGGQMLLQVQRLWQNMMPAIGTMRLEFTTGGGDADNAKARAFDAARRLSILSARTTKKRWQYLTDMALFGLHPEDIAQKHRITGDPVRRTLKAALEDIAR